MISDALPPTWPGHLSAWVITCHPTSVSCLVCCMAANCRHTVYDVAGFNPFTGNPGQPADVHSVLPQPQVYRAWQLGARYHRGLTAVAGQRVNTPAVCDIVVTFFQVRCVRCDMAHAVERAVSFQQVSAPRTECSVSNQPPCREQNAQCRCFHYCTCDCLCNAIRSSCDETWTRRWGV